MLLMHGDFLQNISNQLITKVLTAIDFQPVIRIIEY